MSADLLPLKPADFLVLVILTEGEAHGYGIKKQLPERSGGAIDLEPGTLYRLIARLEGQGLVAEAGPPKSDSGDERRRYYSLTPLGRRIASLEATRLASLVASDGVRRLIADA